VAVLFASSAALGVTTSWLQITGNGPNNDPLTGSHTLVLPGYGGTATVTKLASTGSGTLELRKIAFYSPVTFSEYPNNGLDPTNADNYAISGFTSDTGNTVTARFDFSTLTNGYLPAGAIFMVIDIDTQESIDDVTAYNGAQITTPWLALQSQFDSSGISDGPAIFFPPISVVGGVYDFGNNFINSDVPVLYFLTTQNIDRIEFTGTSNFGPRGSSVAFGIHVPEPASVALVGLGCAAAGMIVIRRK
jgi:hypothetical protein